MAIDPSIILGVRPVQIQTQDPIEQYSKAATLKALMGQGQLQTLQTEKATRDLDHEKRIEALFSGKPGATPEDVMAIDPQRGFAFKKLMLEGQKAQVDLDKGKLEVQAAQAKDARDTLAGVKDQASYDAWKQYGAGKGYQVAASAPAQFDPQWQQQHLLTADKFIDQIDKDKTRAQTATAQAETARHNRSTEATAGSNLALHRLTADPFGLLGSQPGAMPASAGGVPANAAPAGATAPAQAGGPLPAKPANVLAGITPDTHGDEFLAKLPPNVAGQVKALAEGRMAFPSGMGLRSPVVQQLLGMVSQYDPSFDAVNYQGRNKTFTSFSGGADAEKVKNINQTLHHAGQLSDAIDKLDNFNGLATPLNSIVNPVEKLFGDSRPGVFEQKAQAVASELRKVYAGAGGGGLAELQKWEESLPVNASKTQQKAYLKSGMELLNGALSAMQEKYQAGMGPRADVGKLLKPESRAILQRLAPGALGQEAASQNPAVPSPADIDAELRRRGAIK